MNRRTFVSSLLAAIAGTLSFGWLFRERLRTLMVGKGCEFATAKEAIAAARRGDRIEFVAWNGVGLQTNWEDEATGKKTGCVVIEADVEPWYPYRLSTCFESRDVTGTLTPRQWTYGDMFNYLKVLQDKKHEGMRHG